MKYSDQLKHPKWQKRRLEILEAADWKCEDCGSTNSQLEIHHCFYIQGINAWEHGRDLLICVCHGCHVVRQKWERALHVSVARVFRFKTQAEIEAEAWSWIDRDITQAQARWREDLCRNAS